MKALTYSFFKLLGVFALGICFAQESLVEETQALDLAFRMHIRSELIKNAEERGPYLLESLESSALNLEKLTQKVLMTDLHKHPLKEEQVEQLNSLWKILRESGYWNLLNQVTLKFRETSSSLYGRYSQMAKLRGIGYSTYYFACKTAGLILGIVVLAQRDLATAATLNSFPWNSSIALILDLPARVLRSLRLRWHSGSYFAHRRFKKYIKKIQGTLSLQGESPGAVPYSLLDEENGDLPRMLSRIPLKKNSAERAEKELVDFSRDLPHDEKLSSILNSKVISRPLRLALAWTHLRERYPGEAFRLEQELHLKSNYAIVTDPELLAFSRKIVKLKSISDLESLFDFIPFRLSVLQRLDLWLSVVLPYLAKYKKNEIGFFEFRGHYLKVELAFSDALYSFERKLPFDWVYLQARVFRSPSTRISQCKKALIP